MSQTKNSLKCLQSITEKPSPIFMELVFLFVLIASASFVNAQSKDRNNPTPITSNNASPFFDGSNTNEGFYHSFAANPGELKITFNLEAGKRSVNQIELDVFDEDARKLATKNITAGSGQTEQAILRINVEKRQTLLLRVTIWHANGEGQYRLQLDGAAPRSENTLSSGNNDKCLQSSYGVEDDPSGKGVFHMKTVTCFPKEGTLIIQMKDGSIKTIDLEQAKEILIKP